MYPEKYFAESTKKFCIVNNKWNCKLKLQNYCRIKEMILLIKVKLKKFCKSINNIFFPPHKKTVFSLRLNILIKISEIHNKLTYLTKHFPKF